jgi:hypothetical protein
MIGFWRYRPSADGPLQAISASEGVSKPDSPCIESGLYAM